MQVHNVQVHVSLKGKSTLMDVLLRNHYPEIHTPFIKGTLNKTPSSWLEMKD